MRLPLAAAILISLPGLAYAADDATAPNVRDPRAESRAYFAHLKAKAPIHYFLGTQRFGEAIALFPSVEEIDAIDPTTGKTLLTTAAGGMSSDAYDAVRALVLTHGADVSQVDQSGLTALHFASAAGSLPVAEFLVKHGANIHAAPPEDPSCVMNCKKSDRTPLYVAYLSGHQRVRDFLVSMGAHLFASDLVEALEHNARRLEIARKHLRGSPPRGIDQAGLEDWYREKYTAHFNELGEFLRSEGRIDDANRLQGELEPLIQAVMETPREPGMSSKEWNSLVRQNMVRNMIRNKSKEP